MEDVRYMLPWMRAIGYEYTEFQDSGEDTLTFVSKRLSYIASRIRNLGPGFPMYERIVPYAEADFSKIEVVLGCWKQLCEFKHREFDNAKAEYDLWKQKNSNVLLKELQVFLHAKSLFNYIDGQRLSEHKPFDQQPDGGRGDKKCCESPEEQVEEGDPDVHELRAYERVD